ncbi:MAG: DUF1217 domain-containing protein [Gemmobacter sp.]|uniref:DUF1217 domain-containing protein n=1 Tax=Gemmobacter sp. TaxID=1898957 RepID=UPI0039193E02
MSFVPALGAGGFTGWAMLKRTAATQKAVFDRQASIQRDEAYFRDRIGKIGSAEELVNDRRLLSVALGAFGLEADINNRFFIRKVLEDGTLKEGALALKLADKRYREFSAAFGLGDFGTGRIRISDFADRIVSAWKERGFEAAVGKVDESLRLAMNAEREIGKVASASMSEDARWFTLMGQRPVRQVLETAFGLPSSFGTLDIDKQKEMLKQKAEAAFGDGRVSQFAAPDRMQDLVKRYLLRAQMTTGTPAGSANAALAMVTRLAESMRR